MESVMFLGSYLWLRKGLWEVDKCSEYFIIKSVILNPLTTRSDQETNFTIQHQYTIKQTGGEKKEMYHLLYSGE